jgi:hypothetical protein
MSARVRVYFEGESFLRQGFSEFVRKANGNQAADHITFVACGSRARALKMFALAHSEHHGAVNLLLVDAEEEVNSGSAWEHLESLRECRLLKPDCARENSAHLMVQIMEAWFLADKEALGDFYGQRFVPNRLPRRADVENVPKKEVLASLRSATGKTGKGKYNKTVHAPELLARISPGKVRQCSGYCDLFLSAILPVERGTQERK